MSEAMLSLQAIRAKLHQLQMKQQQASGTSGSDKVATPSSTLPISTLKPAELTDKNTSNSLHPVAEKASLTTHSQPAHHTDRPLLQQLFNRQGTRVASNTPSVLTASTPQLTGSVLNRTAELTDRNLSCSIFIAENTATFEVEGTGD